MPFITFEGGEGSGKTVQAGALSRRLQRRGIPVVMVREPGGTPLGERIGRLLKWGGQIDASPLGELLLFNASRAQLVRDVIRPALTDGMVVICDRYADSTLAYQAYGRGLDVDVVRRVNDAATGGLRPDLVVLLDISAEDGFARKGADRLDRFEREDAAFHSRVSQGYLALAAAEPDRWLVVDAGQSKRRIADVVWQRVSQLLGSEGDGLGE